VTTLTKPQKCPTCGKPADPLHRPFCSTRCKDIDLGRWLSEEYRVPVVEEDQGADEEDEG
jgi:endogenous inhibitor of DNA gyrase (YacG/DUF329 family)